MFIYNKRAVKRINFNSIMYGDNYLVVNAKADKLLEKIEIKDDPYVEEIEIADSALRR